MLINLQGLGEDQLIERLAQGESLKQIALLHGIGYTTLVEAIHRNAELLARYRSARAMAAERYDDLALETLLLADASSGPALQKAKNIADHYRWRAKAYAPGVYGDRQTIDLGNKPGETFELNTQRLVIGADEILARLATRQSERDVEDAE